MRHHVFLVEYNRDITAQKYGAKLPVAFRKDTSRYFSNIPATTALELQRLKSRLAAVPPDYFPDKLDDTLRSSVVTTVLQALEELDPSKTKEYTPWLARVYGDGTVKLEDVNRQGLLDKFTTLKVRKKLTPEHRDIMRFRTYKEFENAVASYPEEDTVSTDRGQYEEVYKGTDARILKPQDQTAACFWGRGTRWCTAGRENNQFNNYHRGGPVYILIPKQAHHDGEKYQFWFDRDLSQFESRDEHDEWADPAELKRAFPQAISYLTQHEPLAKNALVFAEKHHVMNAVQTMVKAADAIAKHYIERDKKLQADVRSLEQVEQGIHNALMSMTYNQIMTTNLRYGGDDTDDDGRYEDPNQFVDDGRETGSMVIADLPGVLADSVRMTYGTLSVVREIVYAWREMKMGMRDDGTWFVRTTVHINRA